VTFNPITAPVDYVLLAGQRSPGIAEIVGASSPRRWDERRGTYLSGGTWIFRGLGLASFKLLLRLYTEQDWIDWATFRELVQRPPVFERARALEIVHPILEDLGIVAVIVKDVMQPVQTGDGEWTIEIPLAEYRRPQVQVSRQDGTADQPAEPEDPADRTLRALAGLVAQESSGQQVSFRAVNDALAGL
jgi:hypothetical protein